MGLAKQIIYNLSNTIFLFSVIFIFLSSVTFSSAAVIFENGMLNLSGNVAGDNLGIGGSSFNLPGGISGRGIAFPSTRNDALRIYGEHDNAETSNLVVEIKDNQNDGLIFRTGNINPPYNNQDFMKISKEKMYFLGDKTGIGTKEPTALFEVDDNVTDSWSENPVLSLRTRSAGGSGGPAMDFRHNWQGGVTYNIGRIASVISEGYSGQMVFFTASNNGNPDNSLVERMRITNNGKVGINAKNPTTMFQIGQAGTGSHPNVNVNSFSLAHGSDYFYIIPKTISGDRTNFVLGIGDDSDDMLSFSSFQNANLFTISGNGRVGVGTSSPTAFFEIDDNVTDSWSENPVLSLRTRSAGGSGGPAMDFRHNWQGGVTYNIGRIASVISEGYSGQMVFFTASNNGNPDNSLVERMRITNTGKVGIGTNNPQSSLQVKGYTQIDSRSSSPPGADCDSDAERGRMILDYTNSRLYVCNGLSRGWDYLGLTN